MLKWILLYLLVAVIVYFVLAIFVKDESYDDWEDERMPNWLVALLWGVLTPYEFECGSGSGWCYGATITAMCCLENKVQETEICRW